MGDVPHGALGRLLELERQALLRSGEGQRLEHVLEDLLLGLEQLMPGAFASVLVVDSEKNALVHGAAPSLPAGFLAAVEPVAIADNVGSCGTAAFRKAQVTVDDIAKSPLWSGYHELAATHRLGACWSTPFFNSRGDLLGTFAVYYRDPRAPAATDLELINAAERSVAMIVERSRLWEQAQNAKAFFEAIFRGAADAIIIIDDSGRFLDANDSAARLTGWSIAELKTLRVGALAADPERLATGWHARGAPGGWGGDVQLKRKDGTAVPVETRITRVKLVTGDVFVSSMRDVSERRQLEELQQDFIGTVAHELRNPLGAIHLAATVMKLKSTANPGVALDRIIRQTKQLDRLVTDLLEAHQLESGRLKLELASADLVAIAKTCIAELADPEQRARLQGVERLDGEWDADRICQVLRNLLSNAFKYSTGGEVTVRVEEREGRAVVSVIDQGHGIAEEALPRVFDRFYRASGSATTARGFGVGLYVCRQLVEAHGGTISVSSKPGQGTTFTVELPLTAPAGR